MRIEGVLAGLLLAVTAVGCNSGPKVYPVRGKVVLADGDIAQLAGHHVEFVREDDPAIRADGQIGADGSFELQTMQQGKLLKGAVEGKYQARIVLGEGEDDERPKRRGRPVHERFLDFKSSGLTYQVPTEGDITINLSKK